MVDVFEKHAVFKKKGEIVFCEHEIGNTLFFIQDGYVRLSKIASNKEKTLADLGPGEIIGEMAILEKMPRSATCIALTDVKFLELGNENFSKLVEFKPEIGVKLLKILSNRIKDQKRKLKIIRLPDDELKIIDTFLMLDENSHHNSDEHSDVKREQIFEIDAEDLASWSGMSAASCGNILKTLERTGKISCESNKIKVYNINHFRLVIESRRRLMGSRS